MPQNVFVMTDFFASDCPHCQSFQPIWSAAAHDTPQLTWEQKECFSSGWAKGPDNEFCKISGVNKFPTVKLLHYGQNGDIDQSWDFNGRRTVEELQKFSAEKTRGFSEEHSLERSLGGACTIACAPRIFCRQSIQDFL